jgi:hypothetical protein
MVSVVCPASGLWPRETVPRRFPMLSITCKCLKKPSDTVGEPPSTEMGVLDMPSWKAKKLRKLPQEKVLLEL